MWKTWKSEFFCLCFPKRMRKVYREVWIGTGKTGQISTWHNDGSSVKAACIRKGAFFFRSWQAAEKYPPDDHLLLFRCQVQVFLLLDTKSAGISPIASNKLGKNLIREAGRFSSFSTDVEKGHVKNETIDRQGLQIGYPWQCHRISSKGEVY